MRTTENDTFLKELTAAGYRIFKAGSFRKADALHQKTILDKDGKKAYFINFWQYSFSQFANMPPEERNRISYETEVCFFSEKGSKTRSFKIEHSVAEDETLQEVEDFCAEIYTKMNCVPDIHNND